MYAVTSRPFVKRTRAILRSAEFGFLGVVVRTCVHTPRFWGAPPALRSRDWWNELSVYWRAGDLLLLFLGCRPLRINWLIVGMKTTPSSSPNAHRFWACKRAY